MTEPDEATMPDRPEKAHGDALDDLVEGIAVADDDVAEAAQED
jgi:hypothetical protein